jgi:hypothetical protein
MKLSKRVPARTLTERYLSCQKFLVMSDTFRNTRARSSNPMTKCHWCKKPFENGDQMWLAIPEQRANRALCSVCAAELLKTEGE